MSVSPSTVTFLVTFIMCSYNTIPPLPDHIFICRRDCSDATAKLFAPLNTAGLDDADRRGQLGRSAARASQNYPSINSALGHGSAYVDDDQSSAEFKAMTPFLTCSEDWEQLRFFFCAPAGINVSADNCTRFVTTR